MTEQDKINSQHDKHLSSLDVKFELFMEEARQQREDIRRLHERQDEERRQREIEMRELQKRQDAIQAKHDADMKAMQKKHDADMQEIRKEIQDMLKNLHGLTVAAMVGIAAISVGVLGLLWTTAQNMSYQQNPPPQPAQYQMTESAAQLNP